MKLDMNIMLMLLGVILAYYFYSTTTKKSTDIVHKFVESEETVESEIEAEDNIKEDETEILSDESNYDTEKFLDDNLLDDVDLHNNNEEDFLNNIEKLLEKEDALNNMLEDENSVPEKKNVEEYSIEFKNGSDKQDIQTTIENNAQVNDNALEHNDNWEHNSLMFRDMLNQDSNKVEIIPHKEEVHMEVPKAPVENHMEAPIEVPKAPVEHSNIQTNEITGYTDDSYYSLQ